MAMSQQDKQRFLQALDTDPEFLMEVRKRLLSKELLELPDRFARFSNEVLAFIARQEETNAEFRAFNTRQEETNSRQEETNARIERRQQRILDDIGDLKGHVAGRVARDIAEEIAERLGFEFDRELSRDDLRRMFRNSPANDIARGDRFSFYRADLVARVLDEEGNPLFMAAEASYTADKRDTERALRNAGFLTRFTGLPAVAIIVSLRNDNETQELVDAGTIRWHQFDRRDISPE